MHEIKSAGEAFLARKIITGNVINGMLNKTQRAFTAEVIIQTYRLLRECESRPTPSFRWSNIGCCQISTRDWCSCTTKSMDLWVLTNVFSTPYELLQVI